MDYNKFEKLQASQPFGSEDVEKQLRELKDEVQKKLFVSIKKLHKEDVATTEETLIQINVPIGEKTIKSMISYIDLIYAFVWLMEKYADKYYDDQYAFFLFFLELLLEKNGLLIKTYLKQHNTTFATLEYEEGRDKILDVWKKALKELKRNFPTYSPHQFKDMLEQNSFGKYFTQKKWFPYCLPSLHEIFNFVIKIIYKRFRHYRKRHRNITLEMMVNFKNPLDIFPDLL